MLTSALEDSTIHDRDNMIVRLVMWNTEDNVDDCLTSNSSRNNASIIIVSKA